MASHVQKGMLFSAIMLVSACSVAPLPGARPEVTSFLQPTPAAVLPKAPSSAFPPPDVPDFRQGLIPQEQGLVDRFPNASIYQIEIELLPNDSAVIGSQKVVYTNQEEDTPLNEIYFHLFPNILGGSMSVTSARVNGQRAEVAYEMEGAALRLALPSALPPGQKVTIEMDFQVSVPRQMDLGYGLLNHTDGIMALDSVYPSIAVFDEEGWHKNPPPPNSDLTFADVSFCQVRITSPVNLVVASSGREVDREVQGDKKIQTFIGGPMRDFYLAASEDFVVVSEPSGATLINSYAKKGKEDAAREALIIAQDALRSYNDRFGIYPFSELDLVSTPMQSLGIEYPGIVGLSLKMYEPGETITGIPNEILLESVTAHEVAHQWFYNSVGNDQIEEPWLDEALAQYATGLYYLDTDGENASLSYKESWIERWERVNSADIPIGLPAGDYTAEEYGAIIYGRGPLFLETLADTMGRERFDTFLKQYSSDNKWGIATTQAFKNLAQEACSCDLEQLFEEWVY